MAGWGKKHKGLMDTDGGVGDAGKRRVIRGMGGNGKNAIIKLSG